jgi:hypothetical protein
MIVAGHGRVTVSRVRKCRLRHALTSLCAKICVALGAAAAATEETAKAAARQARRAIVELRMSRKIARSWVRGSVGEQERHVTRTWIRASLHQAR